MTNDLHPTLSPPRTVQRQIFVWKSEAWIRVSRQGPAPVANLTALTQELTGRGMCWNVGLTRLRSNVR